MEIQGFAQLPCKHTFHIRCMVPSCDRFWGNGPIGCKICGSTPSNSLESNAFGGPDVVLAANDEQEAQAQEAPNVAQAQALINQRELTVDDAYRMVADMEDKNYEDKVAAHAKILTEKQKADLKMYVKTCRIGRKLKKTVMGEMIRRKREFIKKNDHLICAFNKVYRKFVEDFMGLQSFKVHAKNFKKNRKLYNKLLNEATDNQKYNIEDLAMALKYSRIPMYLNFDVESARSFRYRFYKVQDMLFNVKNLGKSVY